MGNSLFRVLTIDDTSIRVFDLNNGLENVALDFTVDVVEAGGPELNLAKDRSNTVVSVIYRGYHQRICIRYDLRVKYLERDDKEWSAIVAYRSATSRSLLYVVTLTHSTLSPPPLLIRPTQDGLVRWMDAGVSAVQHDGHVDIEYATPTMLESASFECARAIHYVPHDSKIAIFCDGGINENGTLVNSTVWVIDETLLRSATESAIVYSDTLLSSHHGVAVPVDDNHILYSLPTEERLAGNSSRSYSLPSTFEVSDFAGAVVHSIDDTEDKDKSCSGFHGSWAKDNTFALACDDVHGGILVVDFDETTGTFASRALSYPSEFPDHRTGGFAEHPLAPVAVGNFASMEASHLIRFDPFTASELTSDNVMTLPSSADGYCGFGFEESEGQLLMILLPDGTLSVYDVTSAWDLVVSQKVVPDMPNCTDVSMVAGFGQAFIMTGWNNKMYGINMMNLLHAADGDDLLQVSETTLPFKPYSAVVAGVPQDVMCRLSDVHDEHEEEEEGMEPKEEEKEPAAVASGHPEASVLLGLFTAVAAMAAL
jgi:hypothetical protein